MFSIKAMRERANFTQRGAAEALCVSPNTYIAWEQERHAVSFEQAIQIADLFGCSLDELAGRQFRVAEIVPMPETPMHSRLRSAFERLNRDGREYLASQIEAMLKVPAFCDEAARPFAAAPATA